MLIDNVTLLVKAGNGGNGAATFRRDAQTAMGGPDGGNGGSGGNIYFQGTTNVTDLREFRFLKVIKGKDGANGSKNNGFGKNAQDLTFFVPLGTHITDLDTGKTVEIFSMREPFLVARGGAGGYGNVKFKTATNQKPTNRELGGPGEVKHIYLELKIIADIGLIGLPNAGKSSLLKALTHATPRIAAYPFTTLEPNIGMLGKYALADIPGLIEGASKGVGLGIKFLKHIEKTKILIHCIDITSADPLKAYVIIRKEFKEYNPILLEKKELIFLNKTDLVDKNKIAEVVKLFKPLKREIFAGSTQDKSSIEKLKQIITKLLSAS